jgi:hypothetical protein
MHQKQALFVGCSFTNDCGFTVENQLKYHWPHLFCQQTNYNIHNHAIGGMSNHEIFLRTSEQVAHNSYDLVVVMWSGAGRHWAYCADNNIDDFTILNSAITKGLCADSAHVKSYAELHYKWFNNRYIAIKQWLLYSLALENFLKNINIPYIFIKGFDNNISDLLNATYDNGFHGIDNLKSSLDFDNRPDDYILKKLNVLQSLLQKQDTAHWLNLDKTSFWDSTVDVADDLSHPGIKTNAMLASSLVEFYKELNV